MANVSRAMKKAEEWDSAGAQVIGADIARRSEGEKSTEIEEVHRNVADGANFRVSRRPN
jgi:hypothetical protein